MSKNAEELYDTLHSPLGLISVFYRDDGGGVTLRRISFVGPTSRPLDTAPGAARRASLPGAVASQFIEYFGGRRREFDIPFQLSGSDFDRKVWLALREIPYGATRTYKWLAGRVGTPRGVRAVGQALRRNPLPLILPCHRVIQSDGSLGGFSAGITVKRRLLDLEYYNSL